MVTKHEILRVITISKTYEKIFVKIRIFEQNTKHLILRVSTYNSISITANPRKKGYNTNVYNFRDNIKTEARLCLYLMPLIYLLCRG